MHSQLYCSVQTQNTNLISNHQSTFFSVSCEQLNQQVIIPRVECLEFKQQSQATSTIASSETSPRKISEISTEEEDNSSSEDYSQTCQNFHGCGFCMKGSHCDEIHENFEMKSQRKALNLSIIQNFPQIVVLRKTQRIRSFLG